MPQLHKQPFGVTHPSITGSLELMESIAAQLPELFREAKRQAYELAIEDAVRQGFSTSRAGLLYDYNPYVPEKEAAA